MTHALYHSVWSSKVIIVTYVDCGGFSIVTGHDPEPATSTQRRNLAVDRSDACLIFRRVWVQILARRPHDSEGFRGFLLFHPGVCADSVALLAVMSLPIVIH